MAFRIWSKRLAFISILLFLFSVEIALSQKNSKKKQSKNSKPIVVSTQESKPKPVFLDESFQTQIDKLPENFNGHNTFLLIDKLKSLISIRNKGEFETTEQFNRRTEMVENFPIFGSVTLNSTFAFIEDVNRPGANLSSVTNKYDADIEIMTYSLNTEYLRLDGGDEYSKLKKFNALENCFCLESKTVFRGEFIKTGPLGKVFTLKNYDNYIPCIWVFNWKFGGTFNSSPDYPPLEIKVKLAVDRALLAKENSRTLFVGKIIKPFLSVKKRRYEPTTESPYDWNTFNFAIHFDLEEVWIFNNQTGEIYSKTKIKEDRNKSIEPESKSIDEIDEQLEKAQTAYKVGQYDEAMQLLKKVIYSKPIDGKAHLLVGKIHLRRGDIEQATISLKTALFYNNNLIDAHIALAKIFIERKDCRQAQNYVASAKVLDEDNPEVGGIQRQLERCSK